MITAIKLHIKKLVYSALFLAIAMVLPFLTGNIPQIGGMLCPMHMPALLCGFICGWQWGLAVGAIAPLLRFFLFHMPPIHTALAMTFELAAYGAVAGIMYKRLPKKPFNIYVTLITAMVFGRLVWGVASYVLAGLQNTSFSLSIFWAGAVANAIPGIIVQIVIIPLLVMGLRNSKIMLNE